MQCDWYAATIPDNILNVQGFLMNNLGGTLKLGRSGLNGYRSRAFLEDEESKTTLATILWGGNNGANPHIFSTSDNAPDFMNLVRNTWSAHVVTRVDVAEDMDGGAGLFSDLTGRLVKFAEARRLSVSTVGDWLTADAKEGRTLYIGSKSSAAQIRLYEKGKQLAKDFWTTKGLCVPDGFPLDWVRMELQLRPQKGQRESAASASLEELWGYTAWTKAAADEFLSIDVPRVQGNVWKKSADERLLQWIAHQYGSLFRRRFDALGSDWAAVGEELSQYIEMNEQHKMILSKALAKGKQ